MSATPKASLSPPKYNPSGAVISGDRPIPPPKPLLSECITIVEVEGPINFLFPKCTMCSKRRFRRNVIVLDEINVCICKRCARTYDIKNEDDYRRVRDIRRRIKQDIERELRPYEEE